MYAISNDQSFNNMLTNDIVSFEQLGPVSLNTQGKYGNTIPENVETLPVVLLF